METTTEQATDELKIVRTVEMLLVVQERMRRWGYRPMQESDKPKLRRVFLRVEVQRYYLLATVNDRPGEAAGTQFIILGRDHLIPENKQKLFQADYDPNKPANNDFRWFVKIQRS